jgi:hypothetical protein
MAKQRKRPTRLLHLGPWLTRLGRKPVELAKAVDIGEPYVSSLISGKRKGTPSLLLDISEWLGISVNDLYRPPPSAEAMKAVEGLTTAEAAVLARALETLQGRKIR